MGGLSIWHWIVVIAVLLLLMVGLRTRLMAMVEQARTA